MLFQNVIVKSSIVIWAFLNDFSLLPADEAILLVLFFDLLQLVSEVSELVNDDTHQQISYEHKDNEVIEQVDNKSPEIDSLRLAPTVRISLLLPTSNAGVVLPRLVNIHKVAVEEWVASVVGVDRVKTDEVHNWKEKDYPEEQEECLDNFLDWLPQGC